MALDIPTYEEYLKQKKSALKSPLEIMRESMMPMQQIETYKPEESIEGIKETVEGRPLPTVPAQLTEEEIRRRRSGEAQAKGYEKVVEQIPPVRQYQMTKQFITETMPQMIESWGRQMQVLEDLSNVMVTGRAVDRRTGKPVILTSQMKQQVAEYVVPETAKLIMYYHIAPQAFSGAYKFWYPKYVKWLDRTAPKINRLIKGHKWTTEQFKELYAKINTPGAKLTSEQAAGWEELKTIAKTEGMGLRKLTAKTMKKGMRLLAEQPKPEFGGVLRYGTQKPTVPWAPKISGELPPEIGGVPAVVKPKIPTPSGIGIGEKMIKPYFTEADIVSKEYTSGKPVEAFKKKPLPEQPRRKEGKIPPGVLGGGLATPEPTRISAKQWQNIWDLGERKLLIRGGKLSNLFKRLLKNATGKTSILDLTPQEADFVADIIERSPARYSKTTGKLLAPHVPKTKMATAEFFEKKFAKPSAISYITPSDRYLQVLGTYDMVSGLIEGKKRMILESQGLNRWIRDMENKIYRIERSSAFERGAKWLRNLPNKAKTKWWDMLNDFPTAEAARLSGTLQFFTFMCFR